MSASISSRRHLGVIEQSAVGDHRHRLVGFLLEPGDELAQTAVQSGFAFAHHRHHIKRNAALEIFPELRQNLLQREELLPGVGHAQGAPQLTIDTGIVAGTLGDRADPQRCAQPPGRHRPEQILITAHTIRPLPHRFSGEIPSVSSITPGRPPRQTVPLPPFIVPNPSFCTITAVQILTRMCISHSFSCGFQHLYWNL